MQLDLVQQRAVDAAISQRLTIINGGAGYGKTTLIKAIADNLRNVKLCAFAGKAAARLKEATGHQATTIHSMLRYNGVGFTLKNLDGKTVVFDESSMPPASLFAEIIRRKPLRIVLVGDEAQLTPVGKGQPFHDLIALRPGLVHTLTTCYRASEAVHQVSMMIRRGEVPPDQLTSERERWSFIKSGDPEKTHAAILSIVRGGNFNFDTDIILTPRNGESPDQPCTVKSLNRDIAAIVNPREGSGFEIGDRVIWTKNFADKEVYNGTTGKITAIDSEGLPFVKLDAPLTNEDGDQITEVACTKDMAKNLDLAYALTVHKAQGSQFRNVMLVTLTRDRFALLDRSLIYTGVTRTQKSCAAIGEKAAFVDGIATVKTRRTVMQEVLKAG